MARGGAKLFYNSAESLLDLRDPAGAPSAARFGGAGDTLGVSPIMFLISSPCVISFPFQSAGQFDLLLNTSGHLLTARRVNVSGDKGQRMFLTEMGWFYVRSQFCREVQMYRTAD